MATILAVDKDPLQLDLLSHLLQGQGHRVHATGEPDQALDLNSIREPQGKSYPGVRLRSFAREASE